MRSILVNDRCLHHGGTGVSVYLRNVLDHWPEDSGLHPVGFCTDRSGFWRRAVASRGAVSGPMRLGPLSDSEPPARRSRSIPYWVRRWLLGRYNASFAREFRRGRYVACLEPNSLAVPTGGLTVTTMTDLSVMEHPEWHPPDRAAQWRANLERSLQATDHWIVYSEFVKRTMLDRLGIEADRITVIPLAARPLPFPPRDEVPRRLEAAGAPKRYLLHLGTLEPRKNLAVLLDAWARLAPGERQDCRLILAGPRGWGGAEYRARLMGHPAAGEVLATGYVSDAYAALLLAGATAVLVPSFYEGFGLPPLEAMACGTPVVCSTAEALRELVGDAADLVPPDDVDGWASAMSRAIRDESWRADRRRLGLARAASFSWHRTAGAHAELFNRLLG